MSKKAVLAVCLSTAAILSGGLGIWYGKSTHGVHEELTDRRVEDSTEYRKLLSKLQSAEKKLDAAESENASLLAARGDLESKLARIEEDGSKESADLAEADGEAAGSGLRWAELSSLIAENLDILEKLARGEALDPEDQSKYDLLSGELLKISSKAKLLSKDPFLDQPIFRELVSALFGKPLALSEKQMETLNGLMDDIFEGLPADIEGMSSLERYRLRKDIAGRLEKSIEGLLDDEQKGSWEGIRSFARNSFSYGGRMTLGTEVKSMSFFANWFPNAVGRPGDEATIQAVTPLTDAYLEQARNLVEKYASTPEAFRALSPEAKSALEGEFLDLQKTFYEELGPHLGEDLRARIQQGDPLIIRFEPGQSTAIMGRRRYF